MMKAPTTVPQMVPSPPIRLVPPRTTAAIASSSNPTPVFGCAELSRAARTRPASPARTPPRTYTRIWIPARLIPASRAASALPPTAYT